MSWFIGAFDSMILWLIFSLLSPSEQKSYRFPCPLLKLCLGFKHKPDSSEVCQHLSMKVGGVVNESGQDSDE